MPTGRAERRWEGSAAVLVLVLLLAGLVGCTPQREDGGPPEVVKVPASADPQIARLLQRRARAVRNGDLPAFLADVDERRPRFRARQERYFLNLRELPLQVFRYALDDGLSTLADGRLQAVVELRLQLRGYDAAPVRSRALFTFRQEGDGTWLLAEDRDRRFEADNDVEPQPWDLMRIEVATGDGVLGVFDRRSVDAAYRIIAAIEDGIDQVAAEVPMEWSERVVVYALSDLTVLASLDNLPGGDPNRLDGVAFPVRVAEDSPRLAGTRFMLHPRMIFRDDAIRSRLVRHELTHVAIGRRDDRVPTWLAEGIAEYVSVQAIPEHERKISREALELAMAGPTALPRDAVFNGESSGANYGLAWFACEYVADTFGVESLWRLLDAMRAGDGTPEGEQDLVLREVLGIDSAELARVSAEKIVNTFG
jgi:hypothetical protein